jgi:hypothetical protein
LTGTRDIDWRRVSFRVRADIGTRDGRSVAQREALVEPLRPEALESGGFPMAMHVPLAPGEYRIRLEAYPLISARDAGLDSLPRGIALVDARVPQAAAGEEGWRLGDVHVFRGVRRWEPGAPPERTWYEWIVAPSVSRTVAADTARAYLAFELSRDVDVVPRCGNNSCRIVVTVRDLEGAVRLQDLRPVPASGAVSAYLIPIEPGQLAPGDYEVLVEIFDGREAQTALSRTFRVGPS